MKREQTGWNRTARPAAALLALVAAGGALLARRLRRPASAPQAPQVAEKRVPPPVETPIPEPLTGTDLGDHDRN